MDCSSVKISHSSYRYESLKWFTEDLLVPIEQKGTTWQLPSAFFPRRQQFAWKAANAEWGSDGDKGSILVSKGFFESDEMPLRSLTGVILDNENIIKTILKRVRWLPEDTMSQLASVAKLLNKVQLQVWSSWKQEQTPMQNDWVTLQCNPSSYEIGLAMKRSHLLTYYALHTDDNYSGKDSSSSFSEEIANDESLCAEAPLLLWSP